MKSLGHILGASARFDLLRAVYYQHDKVGLRQLARLAGVHPHSAERMLRDLVDEGVIIKTQMRTRPMFNKNEAHQDWLTLQAVFDVADRVERERHNAALNKRARAILPFIEEVGDMLKQARRSVRVA